MIKKERQNHILDLVNQNNFLSVGKLAENLQVSEMTVRRDITELANKNQLIKLFGGAQKLGITPLIEKSTQEKISVNIAEKIQIGTIMNSLIPDDSTIFLGAGTTIYHAISKLNKKRLFVITNSLIAFNYIRENTDYRIVLIGGEFHQLTEEFVGDIASHALKNLNIDISFIATNGIFNDNITTSHITEGNVQSEALKNSKISCVVADSSKLGKSDIYTFCNLSNMDYLITDNKITKDIEEKYSQYTRVVSKEIK